MTAEQNNTLLTIGKQLDDFNATLAPEDKHSLVLTAEVDAIIAQKNKLLSVFKKLKPIFALANGKADMMAALPEIMPAVQALQGDAELSKDLEEIIALIP